MAVGILFITKTVETHLISFLLKLCNWLHAEKSDLRLYIDEKIANVPSNCKTWNPQFTFNNFDEIDLVVTIGGDGTVLYSSWLFQNSQVPPTMGFHLGSLGFLTDFEISSIKDVIIDWINSPYKYTKTTRMRLIAQVSRYNSTLDTFQISQQSNLWSDDSIDIYSKTGEDPVNDWIVLNDVVIDRGPSAYMTQLEVLVDGEECTIVQADGLLFATPTGSTAYSVSAGGSLVHPKVPCILMTPLCPHSLSFRPMILPDSAQVKVVVPLDSRYPAWASFDGKHRIELKQGDSILIRKSSLNMITVDPCSYPCSSLNWFKNLSKYLHWNVRARQKGRDNTEDQRILQKVSISGDHDLYS